MDLPLASPPAQLPGAEVVLLQVRAELPSHLACQRGVRECVPTFSHRLFSTIRRITLTQQEDLVAWPQTHTLKTAPSSPRPSHVSGTVSASRNTPRLLPSGLICRCFFARPDPSWMTAMSFAHEGRSGQWCAKEAGKMARWVRQH